MQTIEKTHARKTKEDIVPHDFQRSGNLLMHFKSKRLMSQSVLLQLGNVSNTFGYNHVDY